MMEEEKEEEGRKRFPATGHCRLVNGSR